MTRTIRPVHLGLILAILSFSGTTTPVASQQVGCRTSDACSDEMYCSNEEICLDVGSCNEVADCNNPYNFPYPLALCIGTITCESGSCVMDCTTEPTPEEIQIPGSGGKCSTNDDCDGGRDTQYCASDGFCEPQGGCAVVDDCLNEANNAYPIAPCMGGLVCNARRCEMDCSGGSDALFMCDTTADCPEPETYCSSYGHCRRYGSCAVVDDCSVFDNFYPMIECVGRQYCEGYMCGIACGEMPIDPAPAITCGTSQDCDPDHYCAGNGLCLPQGACDRPDDCNNADNIFLTVDCLGTMFCESGMCSKQCGDACTTSDDCKKDEYCAGNGICLPPGACDQVEDCNNFDNEFPMIACVGTTFCEADMCGKACGESCTTSDDCSKDEYCAGNGICLSHGACDQVEDCDNFDNEIFMIACEGTTFCGSGMCGKACGEACTTSDDCNKDEYCAGNGICLPPGACDQVEDCDNFDNEFPMIACVGTTLCESGMCGKACGESCTTSDDCSKDEYCAGNGICLSDGTCDQVEDCSNVGNLFIAPACIGALSCDEGTCSKSCDSVSVEEAQEDSEDGDPVVIDMASCTSDSDCLTLASERSVTGWYCAQGVCMNQGSCQSVTDCYNPTNILWNAKKCMGYLDCTKEGICDIVCGEECKNGSRAAKCVVNPCDVEVMCEEAVSCSMTTCDGECKAMFFDAAGKVVECGNSAKAGIGQVGVDTDQDADFAISEEGSSATTIRFMISALLATIVVATAAIV